MLQLVSLMAIITTAIAMPFEGDIHLDEKRQAAMSNCTFKTIGQPCKITIIDARNPYHNNYYHQWLNCR
jgi:hypothetical protein